MRRFWDYTGQQPILIVEKNLDKLSASHVCSHRVVEADWRCFGPIVNMQFHLV